MKSKDIENIFLDFFKKNGYIEKNEFTLIPKDDESLLFTNSGMVQFKNIFLGLDVSDYDKIITSQTCIRVGGKHNDLNNIGKTPHHNTSFKMLGNFCFKNASKKDTISLAWNFLVNYLYLDIKNLYITVHKDDIEAFNIWEKYININTDHIILGNDDTNFWSMADTGPCGYCSEIFYNIGNEEKNLLEIWNLVFMEFNKTNGIKKKLKYLAIDTGMGLERITSVKQGVFDSFKTDILKPLINIVLNKFNLKCDNSQVRIITDHLKTCVLLIKEGLMPSNYGRGYILKKLIRKAIIKKTELLINNKLHELANEFVLYIYKDNLKSDNDSFIIKNVLKLEEDKFVYLISNGKKLIDQLLKQNKNIDGSDIFKLYDTYGIPIDLIKDIMKTYNLKLDLNGFNLEMEKQINRSKKKDVDIYLKKNIEDTTKTTFLGYNKNIINAQIIKILISNDIYNQISVNNSGIIITNDTCFYAEKGGQIGDTGLIKNGINVFVVEKTKELNGIILHYGKMISGALKINDDVVMTINHDNRNYISKNHSATHLLNAALKKVLGNHVKQAGSFINDKYLRFDFTHFKPLSNDEIKKIEVLINKYIQLSINSDIKYTSLSNKEKNRIVSFGEMISEEFCAGTHVKNTSEIGLFKIIKEAGIGTNIRRIEAITNVEIINLLNNQENILFELSVKLNSEKKLILNKIDSLIKENGFLKKRYNELMLSDVKNELKNNDNIKLINNIKIIYLKKEKNYITLVKNFIKNMSNTVIIIFYYENNNYFININTTNDINAKNIINYLREKIKIKGGGTVNNVNGIIYDEKKNTQSILQHIYSYISEIN